MLLSVLFISLSTSKSVISVLISKPSDFNRYPNGDINHTLTHIDSDHCLWLERHCGKSVFSQNEQTMKVHQGQAAQLGQFPWIVHLEIKSKLTVILDRVNHPQALNQERFFFGTCAGTLISRNHVLTAAHCLQNDEIESVTGVRSCVDETEYKVRVFAGAVHLSNDESKMREERARVVSKDFMATHHDFISYDYAIIEIEPPFEEAEMLEEENTIRPACLPQSKEPLGQKFQFSGWGITDENVTTADLQAVEVSKEECAPEYDLMIVTDPIELLCTTGLGDKGDSGTGYIQYVDDRATVVAVHSSVQTLMGSKRKQNVGIVLAPQESPGTGFLDFTEPLILIKRHIWT